MKVVCPEGERRNAGRDVGNSDEKYMKDHILQEPLGPCNTP